MNVHETFVILIKMNKAMQSPKFAITPDDLKKIVDFAYRKGYEEGSDKNALNDLGKMFGFTK